VKTKTSIVVAVVFVAVVDNDVDVGLF